LAAVGALLIIFAEKPLIVRIFLRPPEGEVSTLLLSLLKEMGGMMLMLSVLLWLASRNPVRNVAILDALIAGLCILAVTPLLSLWMTDIRSMYPAYLLWGAVCCAARSSCLALLAEAAGGTLGTCREFLRANSCGRVKTWSSLTPLHFDRTQDRGNGENPCAVRTLPGEIRT
jgi:hypothetical protein